MKRYIVERVDGYPHIFEIQGNDKRLLMVLSDFIDAKFVCNILNEKEAEIARLKIQLNDTRPISNSDLAQL